MIAWALHPGNRPVPTFERLSFERGTVIRGRFAPAAKMVLYSGVLSGGVPDTYEIREDYPTSVPAGLHGALLLDVSKQDEMAVLVRAHFYGQYQWGGTLARVPLGGTSSRELLDDVYDASWSPDGNDLAAIVWKGGQWEVQYPLGKVLLKTDYWLSDIRVSPDGKQVAVLRHPAASRDDRGNVLLLDRDGEQKVISGEWEALEGMRVAAGRERSVVCSSGDGRCVLHSGEQSEGGRTDGVLRDVGDAAARYSGNGAHAGVGGRESIVDDGSGARRERGAAIERAGLDVATEADTGRKCAGVDGPVGARRGRIMRCTRRRWTGPRR